MTIYKVLENKKGLVQVKVLDNGQLSWSQLHKSDKTFHLSNEINAIRASDIVHVRVLPRKQKSSDELDLSDEDDRQLRTHILLVRYALQCEKHRLRMKSCMLFGSQTECETLANGIHLKREALLGCKVKDEGRKLLVLINPVAGQGKGQAIYRKIVEPLFLKCHISTNVVVTHRSKQMTLILQESDLKEYDGVVVVGGDGTVNEALSGYLLRCMKEADRDVQDYRCDIMRTRMPFGVINAGSGDWFATHLHGTRDVTTCALHIIKGCTVRLGASTTHEDGELSAFSFLIQHIGFVGDVIRSCELNRWMGPARYKITPQLTLLKRRLLTAKLTMYLADNPEISPCSDAPGNVTSTVATSNVATSVPSANVNGNNDPGTNKGSPDKKPDQEAPKQKTASDQKTDKTGDTKMSDFLSMSTSAAAQLSGSFTEFVTSQSATFPESVSASIFSVPSSTSITSNNSETSIDTATWGSFVDQRSPGTLDAGREVVRKKFGERTKPFSWDDKSHTDLLPELPVTSYKGIL
ncbi:sphingosine kinase B-like [Littorina saxatilis]|uniref:sphingosine kinase B-like n=1 Tax=Littorina saxatilis TaxID=31220 RepID=UPI0038B68F87